MGWRGRVAAGVASPLAVAMVEKEVSGTTVIMGNVDAQGAVAGTRHTSLVVVGGRLARREQAEGRCGARQGRLWGAGTSSAMLGQELVQVMLAGILGVTVRLLLAFLGAAAGALAAADDAPVPFSDARAQATKDLAVLVAPLPNAVF